MKARELEASLLAAEAEVEAGQQDLSELTDLESCWGLSASAEDRRRCCWRCRSDAAPTAAASDGAVATAAFAVNAVRVN